MFNNVFSGAEAMFADLGHFTVPAIQVNPHHTHTKEEKNHPTHMHPQKEETKRKEKETALLFLLKYDLINIYC